MKSGTAPFLKATAQSTLVGSVRAKRSGEVCHIGRLIVHPDHQGRGIGTALLAAIEAAFPQSSTFEPFTGSRSDANIRLYRRCGYAVSGPGVCPSRLFLLFMNKAGRGAKTI
jgi:GNAT superfamily N-acetyltransferase